MQQSLLALGLVNEIEKSLQGKNTVIAISLLQAIKNGTPAVEIIRTCKDMIADNCTGMIRTLNPSLVQKLINFNFTKQASYTRLPMMLVMAAIIFFSSCSVSHSTINDGKLTDNTGTYQIQKSATGRSYIIKYGKRVNLYRTKEIFN